MTEPHGPGAGAANGPPGGMPRWVKVFVIVLVLAGAAAVVTTLAGVDHGPGLHGP